METNLRDGLARVWATKFACLQTNFTSKFTNEEIIWIILATIEQ
jgi:hypothetical protein